MSAGSASASSSGDAKSFAGVLWDQVERVYLRLTNGRHDLKRTKAYMEARAEMARVWSKSMIKASTQPELEDSSSLGALWHEMKESGVAQAKAQDQFATVCMEIAAALEAQIVEVKKTKTALHDKWTKLLADVKKKSLAHDKAHKEYLDSVKQAETAIMNRDAAHEQKMPDKAVQKAETRAKQALKEVDTLHQAYQKAVGQLQEAQAQQDATCADLLTQFERLERARMQVFLEQLDRWASQHDTLKAQLDSVAASLHTHANAVNIDADVQEFIRTHTTGKQPPPHVEYVQCKSSILDHASGGGGNKEVAGNLAAPNTAFAPPSPAAAGGAGGFGPPSPMNAAAAAAPLSPQPPAAAPAAPAASPAAAPSSSGSGAGSGESAVALYDFDAGEPDDLGFKAGQVIRLLMSSDSEDWWRGELDGKEGIFPKAYVQKQAAGAAAPAPPQPQPPQPAAGGEGDMLPVSNQFAAYNEPEQPAAAIAPSAPAPSPVGEQPAAGGAAGGEVPKLMDAQCAALFDFDGQDDDELSFKAGQTLIITGELNGWCS